MVSTCDQLTRDKCGVMRRDQGFDLFLCWPISSWLLGCTLTARVGKGAHSTSADAGKAAPTGNDSS